MSTTSHIKQAARRRLSGMPVGAVISLLDFTPPDHDSVRKLLVDLEDQGLLERQDTGRHGRLYYRIAIAVPFSAQPRPSFEPLLRIFGYAVRVLDGPRYTHRGLR